MNAMKKTTQKIGLKTETLRNLAQRDILELADHQLNAVAGGATLSCNTCSCSGHCI